MPRVKIAYVVSFSSEDPEHPAGNLLLPEVSKKKWLCSKWEPSSSVVLQLERAIEISAVQIGAYNAALIEVLVGLSERPNDEFQVLVPSCVLTTPAESRAGTMPERVRSFTGDALAPAVRARRYDRVRVVCSQPYNKHDKYGLSFIHINEPENREAPSLAVPSRLLAIDTYSSDEDEFRPGELFAKHHKSPDSNISKIGHASTSAQIRQATAQAFKNMTDSSSKLFKTTINATSSSTTRKHDGVHKDRQRDSIIYTNDDEKPHDKIDRIVNAHKDEKNKENELKQKTQPTEKIDDKKKDSDKPNNRKEEHTKMSKDKDNQASRSNKDVPTKAGTIEKNTDRHYKQNNTPNNRKKRVPEGDDKKRKRNVEGANTNRVSALQGVVVALSGYAGAERAELRAIALELGAQYSADWNDRCTHLICAFPNTPKLRTVRAAGKSTPIATAEWLRACREQRRRLPWQWYATLPAERLLPAQLPADPIPDPTPEAPRCNRRDAPDPSDGDTDDEIERAFSVKKKPRNESPCRKTTADEGGDGRRIADTSADSDVTFVCDERFRGHVSLRDSDEEGDERLTDNEPSASPQEEHIDPTKALPDFFDGYTFVIPKDVGNEYNCELLARYIRAYGGLVIQAGELQEDSEVHYVVCEGGAGGGAGGGQRVPAGWVWRCHRERRLCSPPNC